MSKIDRLTKRWMRNEADERAAANGCRFDESRAAHMLEFCENNFRLYEGEYAGQLVRLMPWQIEVLSRIFGWVHFSPDWDREVRRFRKASIWIPKKNGKALALDTPIPTPNGWTTIGALKVGDVLFGGDGFPCDVVELHPIHEDVAWKLSFSNGESVVCNGDHLWETSSLLEDVSRSTGGIRTRKRVTKFRTTFDIVRTLTRKDGARNHSISMHAGIQTDWRELPIDPYVLGVWLGDGDSDCARISCSSSDAKHLEVRFASNGYATTRNKTRPGSERIRAEGLHKQLRLSGLLRNKHIPAEYLRAGWGQRVNLLQGLMDTDGTISKSGKCIVFTTILPPLRDGVLELLASLGIKGSATQGVARLNGIDCGPVWDVQFHVSKRIPVFTIPRKLDRMTDTEKRSRTIQIVSADETRAEMRCITVSSEDGMFLCGRTMIPTHNSPTAAMVGLYLLIGDGEPGQKVFSAAKDGKQAQIVHNHAKQMVLRSPELNQLCEINKSTGRIYYKETESYYDLLAGDNISGQEGLNGSVVIDETHVVDDRLAKTLEYMGASRSEPLQAEFSTAGDNVDGYGKKQQDYGRAVNEGMILDDSFFCQIYEAPQMATDEECEKPKIWKAANPSWGVTIKEGEFRDSLNRAKRSLTDFITFKKYRLNIWSHSANPFLRLGDWQKCGCDARLEDFENQECWIGLDLAKTKDMTAAVLLFPDPLDDEGWYQFPFFWMPEDEARSISHLASYLQWAKEGDLTLTPGDVTDYRIVEQRIREFCRRFRVQKLVFDRRFAEDLTQRISDDEGVTRLEFSQSISSYSGPTSDYERLVIAGKLRHPKNKVLDWQAGHVNVKSSPMDGKLKMPEKPEHNNHKKIDGIVAGIMALGVALAERQSANSVYNQRGMVEI
jgi:phage terminase large subunit-like protein